MAITGLDYLKNLKIKHKITFTFAVLFVLLINLGALNITSVIDLKDNTDRIADEFVPRLVETDALKNSLNLSILSAYDYVQTGNVASKDLYEQYIDGAIDAQINLFVTAKTEDDLEFTTLFQDHINDLTGSLAELISAYESGVGATQLSATLAEVSEDRDTFTRFLEEEIELEIRGEVVGQQEQSSDRVRNTIFNVALVTLIALVSLYLLSLFMNRSITEPVRELTHAAESIGNGQFELVDIDSKDELGLFADTFNTMTQRIKATQESLEIELEKTKKLDRQKTEFLSIAAHQLRTPMSGIKWLVSMVVEGDLGNVSKDAKNQLGKGLENINRMVSLINSLLDVSQIEMQKSKFRLVRANMVEIVTKLVDEFQHNASDRGVALTLTTDGEIPLAQADLDKIQMAIRNLLDNAIKYTPKKGSVTAQISADESDVIVEVVDTGHGIPKEEQERIFSKFYRGSNIQTVEADGSGLGLFVVKEIIDQHGGEISFESAADEGTTFRIELPQANENTPEPGSEPVEADGDTPDNQKEDESTSSGSGALGV